MDALMDYGGYDSDLEEQPSKKHALEKELDSNQERSYKKNADQLGGFTSYHDKEAWKIQAYHLRKMDAYSRHKELIRNYIKFYGGKVEDFQRDARNDKNDFTILQENHKFLWETDDTKSWEEKIAKKYYDKLFKEYCIADLSKFEVHKIALRWRIEAEVKSGKGQFICGNKYCSEQDILTSWEVSFAYSENEEKKNALVKIRLCPDCSIKLNMVKKVKKVSKKKKRKEKKSKHKSLSSKSSITADRGPEALSQSENISASEENIDDSQSNNIWAGPAPETLIKSNEEEMDEFLEELLL